MADIKKELLVVENVMLDFLSAHTSNDRLLESMKYSICAGGKRLRPQLLLTTVQAFGKPLTKGVFQVSAALEMIHTYSLIHDDLPAMDNDTLRRGKPTNHVAFDEATAILAGDGLLSAAFQLASHSEVPASTKVALIAQLSLACGTEGMVAGQAADVQGENTALNLTQLMAIHEKKTGALLTFPLVAGGLLTGQDVQVIELLRLIGQHFGLAFQIRDDLLDVTSTTAALGKVVGRDEALHKATYPALLGLAGAKKALREELAAVATIVQQLERTTTSFDGQELLQLATKLEI